MSTAARPMPDFADALERHLRHAAAEHAPTALAVAFPLPDAPAGAPGRPRPRSAAPGGGRTTTAPAGRAGVPRGGRPRRLRLPVAAGSLAIVALLVVLVLVLSGSGPATPRALGEPLVLRTPLVRLPEVARPGSTAAFVLGPGSARITTGHAFPVDGGTAYLYRNAAGVCLSVPDPAAEDPDVERGVTCVPTADFRRFGIAGALEGRDAVHYVAALPEGAQPPTVRVRGGALRALRPSGIGVVSYDATGPIAITRYGPGGLTRVDRYLQDPVAPGRAVRRTPIDPADVRRPGTDTGRPDGG